MTWGLVFLLIVLVSQLVGCTGSDSPDAPVAELPDIAFLMIDTLRADRLGCYGNPRESSPNIDRIAAEGVLYERALAAAPWTQPSIASLFSSLYPGVHRVTDYRQAFAATYEKQPKVVVFDERFVTLAERLRSLGYRTAAFVANPYIASEYGFGQGFDHFDDSFAANTTSGDVVNQAALAWLDARTDDAPVFVYLHYMDPHGPYQAAKRYLDPLLEDVEAAGDQHRLTPEDVEQLGYLGRVLPKEYQDRLELHGRLANYREYWEARYEAGVREADAFVGELRGALEERGRWDDSCVVVTADHGEALCEHGFWDHGWTTYQTDLHVPWIIRWPERRQAGARWPATVSLLDVTPTLFEGLGLGAVEGTQGRALSPKSADRVGSHDPDGSKGPGLPDDPRPILAESVKLGDEQKALTLGDWKLIVTPATGERRLFDLDADPGEMQDLIALESEKAEALAELLELQLDLNRRRAEGFVPETQALDPEQIERLRALGYIK